MSIVVEQVSKLYGEQKALDQVNFTVSSGEVIGFLGPNGAGKSTMMKIISGFIPPNEGKVRVCGHDVVEDTMEVKKKVGYLPEHNPLYLDMYVKEYLKFVGSIYKIPNLKQRVDEMIELVGLGLEQHKQIGALSKGYRQRVGIAQAMIHDPEVLILDEPTSGLDPNQLVEIRKLIATIGKEKTVMLSTHIMQEVEAICNRVLIINRGKVVADKPVTEIRGALSSKGYGLTVEFSASVSANELKKIQGIVGAKQENGNNWILEIATDEDVRQLVFNFAVQNKNSVLTMQRIEKSMEDVFKELTAS
jgi:ABC-2 type transport system ATP-binding protein